MLWYLGLSFSFAGNGHAATDLQISSFIMDKSLLYILLPLLVVEILALLGTLFLSAKRKKQIFSKIIYLIFITLSIALAVLISSLSEISILNSSSLVILTGVGLAYLITKKLGNLDQNHPRSHRTGWHSADGFLGSSCGGWINSSKHENNNCFERNDFGGGRFGGSW